MKIVLAPDKFKGSITAARFCDIVSTAILQIIPSAQILKLPLADGGEGTLDLLQHHFRGSEILVKVHDPLFRDIEASYIYLAKNKTAFIEMAAASGLQLLQKELQNCSHTTSFGTGELIRHAITHGAKTIVVGIGGSATNDGGVGMATALGYRFLDKNHLPITPTGINLTKIQYIDDSQVLAGLHDVHFKIACDVDNPLYGKNGAAFVYGAQKGASAKEIQQLDQGLEHLATLILENSQIDLQAIKGSGAAGGMGAGTVAFLNASLHSGIALVKELISFENAIRDANWILTGEGLLDRQTLSGKTIYGVLESAKKQHIPVATLCGNTTLTNLQIKQLGISYADTIIAHSKHLNDAMTNAETYLHTMAKNFARSLLV